MQYNYQKLKDYALWYYFRYFPSNNKLLSKLIEKGGDNLANQVLNDILHLLNEEEVIITKIKNYLFRNKNLFYIKQKLFEKQFDKSSVEKILLREFLEEGKSLLSEKSILKQIKSFKDKGKSINYIKQKLIEREEDKNLVDNCILDLFGEEGDLEELKKEYEKLKVKFDKQKIIEKLLRKGFRYDKIKKILD